MMGSSPSGATRLEQAMIETRECCVHCVRDDEHAHVRECSLCIQEEAAILAWRTI